MDNTVVPDALPPVRAMAPVQDAVQPVSPFPPRKARQNRLIVRAVTALASYLGAIGENGYINRESHPALVAFAGWFFLVGLPMIVYFLYS